MPSIDISERVARNEVVVVCGPSGSGKSTLIRTLNRLEDIDGGSIAIDGRDIHARGVDVNALRAGIGFVFQQFNLFPHLSALENCMLAPVNLKRASKAEASAYALELLDGVGLAHKATPIRTNCRAASSSAWRSPARWRCGRRSCSSTSRPARSTRKWWARCWA